MSRLDIVILGATGFTGKYAVEQMVTLSREYPDITWGIAGRSGKKLRDVLAETSAKTGEDLSKIKIITADCTDYESLTKMCSQARVVGNCCGPYFQVGESVIKAAIASKTHYVDVACEPLFMESMQHLYDKQASDAGVYVISACGMYSIPNDLGILFLEENFKGTLNSVEGYITVDHPQNCADNQKCGLMHKTSWDSMLHSMIHRKQLEEIRRTMNSDPMPLSKVIVKERLLHTKNNGYCVKIPNPEESVVNRTQRHLFLVERKRPVQFHCYHTFRTFLEALITIVAFYIIRLLTKSSLLSKFMLKYPKIFSLGMITDDGPPEEFMDRTKLDIKLHGAGWRGKDEGNPDKTMVAKIFMVNPYRASVVCQNLAALTILKDIDKMPGSGGVLTPGVAFRRTDLIKRLNQFDITFEIISTEAKKKE